MAGTKIINLFAIEATRIRNYYNSTESGYLAKMVGTLLLAARFICIPANLVNLLSRDDSKPQKRERAIETYILLKMLLVLLIVFCLIPVNEINFLSKAALIWILYSMLETLIFIITPIYCKISFKPTASFKRAFLLIMINYFEMLLSFSFLYAFTSGLAFAAEAGKKLALHSLDYIYFSFLSGFTMQPPDILLTSGWAKTILTGQMIVLFFFATVFITYNFGKLKS